MMAGKIYTKKGDGGNTKTLNGAMSKGNQLAITLGTVDELNSWIGVCRVQYPILDSELYRIQHNLLNIGSGLAGSTKIITQEETTHLEELIDKMTAELPELTHFVFPVGFLQVARTVARRSEREVVKATEAGAEVKDEVKMYLNRLSDALFTMARWMNMKLGVVEEVWM